MTFYQPHFGYLVLRKPKRVQIGRCILWDEAFVVLQFVRHVLFSTVHRYSKRFTLLDECIYRIESLSPSERMQNSVVDDLAHRFKSQFEDCRTDVSDSEESQDWFVNDHKSSEALPSPEKTNDIRAFRCVPSRTNEEIETCDIMEHTSLPDASPRSKTRAKSGSLLKRIVSSGFRPGDDIDPQGAAFLHHMPSFPAGVLVMELGISKDQPPNRKYGAKFFRIYVPQVHENQLEFCIYAHQRLNKSKIRFSFDPQATSKLIHPIYCTKLLVQHHSSAESPIESKNLVRSIKRFRPQSTKAARQFHFQVEQEVRKQELTVHLNAQAKIRPMFHHRSASDASNDSSESHGDTYRALIQKFINPIVELRRGNSVVLKIEKEGDTGSEKYIITYAKPLTLFIRYRILQPFRSANVNLKHMTSSTSHQ
uniref:Uncharacterized protein AlNc14C28G2710 n=1 Tax=Albugo laibachii Nc14 TaxID=890382 RepID=F0W782_9STRA|nr:conserved hypothetical protein [Albugo laibachii Nc14]|eukprot:CCA16981.1 conserved hypothetical protein [Albugo laibachii Nc14]